MDRLNLTLFGLDREQEAAIKELFEARGWDYVHEISLPLLNFDETFLARTSFAQPSFATYDTAVASVEPETERQGDSCASAIDVSAGVDVTIQVKEAKPLNWMMTERNASFVFVPRV